MKCKYCKKENGAVGLPKQILNPIDAVDFNSFLCKYCIEFNWGIEK